MWLLTRPHSVILPVCVSKHVILTRLILTEGVRLTELVAGIDRVMLHLMVYADVLKVDVTTYPRSELMPSDCEISSYNGSLCRNNETNCSNYRAYRR